MRLKNLLLNSSLETTEYWSPTTRSTEKALYGSKSFKFPTGGTTVLSQYLPTQPILGHKYYGRHSIITEGNVTCADCRFELFGGDGDGKNWIFGYNQGNHPNWYTESQIITVHAKNASSYLIRTFTVNSTGSIWTDGFLYIDLTEAFGAGHEPDKAWCDANIPYFEGEYDLPLRHEWSTGVMKAPSLIENASGYPLAVSTPSLTSKLFRECYSLTNLVTDGDMSLGQWGVGSNSSFDTAHYKYGTRALKVMGLASYLENVIPSTTYIPLVQNHIYYGRYEYYQETQCAGGNIYWPIAEPSFGGQTFGAAGAWRTHSWRVNRNSFSNGNYQYRLDFDNNRVAGVVWFDGVMIIDLTADFGAGNEPSKEWCDANIPFFKNTYQINIV